MKGRIVNRLLSHFLTGLLFVIPLSVTGFVLYWTFSAIDGLLNLKVPGLGLVITLAFITAMGALGSNLFFRRSFAYFESLLTRLPLVKLIYFALKDLISAFVGEKRRFNAPVLVSVLADGPKALGFLTAEDFEFMGCEGQVAVYFPQSYNFAGNVLLIPRERVTLLDPKDAGRIMAFIVSGGVTTAGPGETPPEAALL